MDRPWIGAGLKYAEVRKGDVPSLLVQRVARLRAKPGLDQRFLGYVIGGPSFTNYVLSVQTGTAVPHISSGQIGDFTLDVPPLSEQMAIAAVLGALDEKITINERIVSTSDLLAQTSYHKASLNEPDEFSDQPLSDAAEFINGRAFTKGATGTGRMVVRIAEINSGPGASTVYNDIEVPEKHLARPGDLLFAWSGSLTAARWYRPEAIINQHIFKVVPREGRPKWLVAALIQLKLEEFRAIAADKATTMGHIQRRHLDEPVLTPSIAMTQKLGAWLGPLWDRALAAEQESLALAALRDTLLPQLMSGKLRVRDAEKIVEETV
ncbi:type I restriction enzyme S subunit [Streptomyces sp. SAI-117]|nr:type I restriction enzyme S subunit [Streptomyces sp. SAI-117]